MIKNGTVDPTIMVTHRFKIDDTAKGYKLQEKRQAGLVKCFIETKHSFPRAQGTPPLTTL
jgi:threonine dehydrogenase-like Zn-dependent dehydrogenase